MADNKNLDAWKKFSVKLVSLNKDTPSQKNDSPKIENSDISIDESKIDLSELSELDSITQTLDILSIDSPEDKKENSPEREILGNFRKKYAHLKNKIISIIIDDPVINSLRKVSPEKSKKDVLNSIDIIVTRVAEKEKMKLTFKEKNFICENVYDDVYGFGPLEVFIKDSSVSEIMVVGPNKIFVERSGKLILSDVAFLNEEHLLDVINKIVTSVGRRIDLSTPFVDARLPDGSRVHAIIPPLTADGSALTIRKFSEDSLQMEDLVSFNSISPEMGFFLGACIKAKLNIVVSGGTGSGKTTLLNILSMLIPKGERLITIEDSLELKTYLVHNHVVRMETRSKNVEGSGEVTIRDLVKQSLRMRPDRIIVGEVRGGEAIDLLQAMNTGHDGSMGTCHANSPNDAISRLESMVLMSGLELPLHAVKTQIGGAVDIIVQQKRYMDGSRKISHITEVGFDPKENKVELNDVFIFKQEAVKKGKVIGNFIPTGYKPSFIDKFKENGIAFPFEVLNIEPSKED